MKTIMTRLLFGSLLSAFVCTFLTVSANADRWVAARPMIFASGGSHGFKVLPKDATGILFLLDDDGKEHVIWKKQLVNIPHQAFVPGDGRRIVTVDTYADLGREHSLVVYDDKGKVLADFRLEDLLSEEEIRDRVFQTSPNRWWAGEASFQFQHEGREMNKFFDISLKWGKLIRVDLDSGKLQAPPIDPLK
jgi:hypothetical protein